MDGGRRRVINSYPDDMPATITAYRRRQTIVDNSFVTVSYVFKT